MTIEQAKIYAKLSDEELNKLGIKAPKAMRAFACGKKIKIKIWDKLKKEYRVFSDTAPRFEYDESDHIIEEEEEYFSVSFTAHGAVAEKRAVSLPKFNGNNFTSLEAAQKRADFINWLLFVADENIIRMLFTLPPPKIEVLPKNSSASSMIEALHDTAAEMFKKEEEF